MYTQAFTLKQDKAGSASYCTLNPVAALMCPKCYNIVRVKQTGYMEVKNEDSGKYADVLVTPVYHLECPSCHVAGEFISIDMLMANAVSKLNKLGYYTVMCCNSHDSETVQNIFIKFKEEYEFETLPAGFEMDGVFLRVFDTQLTRGLAMTNLEIWVNTLSRRC